MDYVVYLATGTDPGRVREVVLERWGVGGDDLGVLDAGAPGSEFGVEVQAGERLARACGGLSEVELATSLCGALGVRGVVSDGGRSSQTWTLVTPDGWHGRVVVDDEALGVGAFRVLHAYQPVPSAPDIPVREPPGWQGGWYDDGTIPEPGYLESRGE